MGENTAVTPVTIQVWNLSCESSAKKQHKNSRGRRTGQGPRIPRDLSEYPREMHRATTSSWHLSCFSVKSL